MKNKIFPPHVDGGNLQLSTQKLREGGAIIQLKKLNQPEIIVKKIPNAISCRNFNLIMTTIN